MVEFCPPASKHSCCSQVQNILTHLLRFLIASSHESPNSKISSSESVISSYRISSLCKSPRSRLLSAQGLKSKSGTGTDEVPGYNLLSEAAGAQPLFCRSVKGRGVIGAHPPNTEWWGRHRITITDIPV